MASASPQGHIDQFYASRKRKNPSPGLKSKRSEKEARITVDRSPSTKGNLDNYLVNSQEKRNAGKTTLATSGSSAVQDSVRRNLALDIDLVSGDEKMEPLSLVERNAKISEGIGNVGKEVSQGSSNSCHLGAGGVAKGCCDSRQSMENPELKQFTADFLSLYCSELQSTATSPSKTKLNDHKRHLNSVMSGGEGNISTKKLHFVDNQLHPEVGPVGSDGNIHSGFKLKNEVSNVNAPDEVMVGPNSIQLQSSLRKCSKTANIKDCTTPSIIGASGRETPKSARGSSLFSPGEEFWNEAIEYADGLFPKVGNTIVQPDEGTQNGGLSKMANGMLGETDHRHLQMGNNSSLVLHRKHVRNSAQEVSPLPVKHLDFLSDDKIFGVGTPCGAADSSEAVRCGKQPECGSVNLKHLARLNPDTDSPNSQVNAIGSSKRNLTEAQTPSSFLSVKDQLDISSWLPTGICSIYKRRGISKLYPWQVECLQVDGVLQRRNLVYSASTSAGKSFVAEILMLRHVMSTSKMALLVLPYVSICAEKAEHLEGLLEPLGKHVRSYYGNQGGGTLPKDTSVAVCTIEKANSLINRLLEEGRLPELGIIVIDELHMVGDQSRGYLLELMLTKLRYAAGEGNSSDGSSGESSATSSKGDLVHGVQIVGMSATMPNVAVVADWLQAALYQTSFRPVPLEEYIKAGNSIYDKKMELVRTIPKAAELGGKDPDHVVELCNEVVQQGHSVLIFCSSRKGCESTARHISKFLKKFSVDVSDDSDYHDISSAINSLRNCPAGLDPTLEVTLPSGVAYHHAGLTVEEREIIETCYRRGLVRVLTATSTLAAGVNLPARRVIFRQPRIGCDFIDGTRYKQMAGRAGRTGIDTKGESVLICKPEELKRVTALLNEDCPLLQSCLAEDKKGMTHAILEVVAGGIVQTANDIHRYVRCTLLNSTKPFRDVVKSAQDSLRWLCHRKFLEWNEDTKLYNTTPLGRASFGSSLCPEESLIVLDDLSRAREGFVLASDLHLVYLVTPINVDVEPDWELYYERFMELAALDQSVGNRVGVSEPFLMRMAHGAPARTKGRPTDNRKGNDKFTNRHGIVNTGMNSDELTLRVCRRFYVALILSRLVQESPIAEVCESFKVSRGMVQALQENAGRFASMVSLFCERLGWHDLEGLVSKFQNRVSFGVRAEIVELTNIPYVKGSRARSLYKAGLRTPLSIAEASVSEIVKAIFDSSSWAGEGYPNRRIHLGVAKKIKNGARKIVLEKAEEARIAAFSAFKSLGISIPQFSRPVLPNAGNVAEVGDVDGKSLHYGEQRDDTSFKFIKEGRKNANQLSSGDEGDNSAKALEGNLDAPTEKSSACLMNCSLGLDNPTIPVQKMSILSSEPGAANDSKRNLNVIPSMQLGQTSECEHNMKNWVRAQSFMQGICGDKPDNICEKGPINANKIFGGIDSFLDLLATVKEFVFDIHYNKLPEVNSLITFEVHGVAICWENSPVYYVNLPKDLLSLETNGNEDVCASGVFLKSTPPEICLEMVRHRWEKLSNLMRKREIKKITWNMKVQMQVLKSAVVSIQKAGDFKIPANVSGFQLTDNSHLLLPPINIKGGLDMCIVAWMLWPDEERSSNPSIEKEAKKRLSIEALASANRSGRWKNQMRRAAHNGCCRRVAQTRALYSVLWKLLVSEGLVDAFEDIEIPLINVLADMELCGIGVDMEGCLQARNVLGKKLRSLEKEAYKLAGITFSLYTTADIANVLYGHLKLPIPEGFDNGKQHPSTDKHCLDLLRNEHPIIPVIREHRTLAKLFNSTIGSVFSLARLSMSTQKYTVRGHWLQTSTATGRLAMEAPNLQCVEHIVDFSMSNSNGEVDGDGDGDSDGVYHKINARDFFVPTQENWLLLTADYSQIELRLMAHFSKDDSLIELLHKPLGDVFNMIAAKWTGKPEESVSPDERDQTKRLVYGILYGMSAKTLARQLHCSSDEAAEKIKTFKSIFPGVASWLHEAVASCQEKGFIETIKGRKRFLSKIKFGNSKEKAKAQRQAVNSICQGSAADIIKIAMINIYSVISGEVDRPGSGTSSQTNLPMLKDRCRLVLQVHDELVLEADSSIIKEAAMLLKTSMESAATLLVPLQVKLKVGRTWGSLEPFQCDRYANEVLMPD